MANFEVFTSGQVRRRSVESSMTIGRRGVFALSQSAHRDLGRPDAVELLYDRDEQVIGLRPATTDSANAYAVRPTNRGKSFVISAIAFTKYYRINTAEARRRPAVMEGDILCIDLKHAGTSVTSNRRQDRSQGTDQ